MIVWNWSASYTKNYVDAGRYTAEYSENAEQKIKSTCVDAEIVAFSKCVYEIVKTTQEAQNSEQDLSAQKDMANWAFWMLAVTTIGSLLTGFGLYFVWKSLALNRAAVNAAIHSNEVAREIGEAQVRAYVSVEVIPPILEGIWK